MKSDAGPAQPLVNYPAISPTQAAWLLGLLVGTLVLLSLGGEPWRLALRYERTAVLNGAYWRLLTGHLVHASTYHMLLNGVGLAVTAALLRRDFSLGGWLLVLASSTIAIDLCFVLLEPQVEWYVGLSGVLHGALAAGVVSWFQRGDRLRALALAAIVLGKLGWEQWHGALPISGDMPVVVDAHVYGAIGGALAGLWLCWRRRH